MKNNLKFFIAILTLCFISFTCGNESTTNSTQKQTTQNPQTQKQMTQNPQAQTTTPKTETKKKNKKDNIQKIRISNDKLVKEFKNNEISANDKYKETTLQVVGKIKSVSDSKNLWGDRIIKVTLGEYLSEQVDCHFEEYDMDELSNLKKGQNVIIEGFCGGTYTFGVVHLFDCVIIKK